MKCKAGEWNTGTREHGAGEWEEGNGQTTFQVGTLLKWGKEGNIPREISGMEDERTEKEKGAE